MKAVAMMTPEPKYFAMKKAVLGTRMRLDLASAMGTTAPKRLPMRMTKMELMRRPRPPLYSLPESTYAEGQHVSVTFVWWDDALARGFIRPGPHGRGGD